MDIGGTLVVQAIGFAIFIWFTWKFVWPPINEAIETRRTKIAEGLAEAEKGKAALAEGEKQKAVMLKEARDQAGEFKTLNEKQALALIEEAKAQAKAEADRIIAAAYAQIEQEKQKAKDQLREQVASLAVVGAEKILQREVNAQAHAEMLSQLKGQL
ncbi:MAG: F0F1 ATP synthase subunit B [Burkholderiales bacterium]|jgi:F-type H+-transporting ATPase subunit b|nr:F0F1 ATP synthase subunit B [Nitrosomonadaceae bacterium]